MDGHNMETETGVKKCTIQVIPGYEGFDKGGVENTKETDQSNVQTGDNNFEVVAGDNMKGSGKEIKDRVVGLVAISLGLPAIYQAVRNAPVLVSLMLNLNRYSVSAQNHRCSTSPWSIPGYRENPQGSTMVNCIVNCSDNLY